MRVEIETRAERELRVVQSDRRNGHATEAPIITFKQIGDLVANPRPIDWLVKNVLERNTTVCAYGEPESGKSLLKLDLGLHIAAGLDWRGARVYPGAVFHLCPEGAAGLARRALAWQIRHGIDLATLPFYAYTMATDLSDPVAAMAIGDAVNAIASSINAAPQLVIVDTLSRHLAGDENSSADMARFMKHVDMLVREPTGACVVLVHHVGHGDKSRARGSTVLRGGVDTEYRVTRDTPSGIVTLEAVKTKDWARPAPLHFKLCTVELPLLDDDGETVTSVVLDPAEAPPKAEPEHQRKSRAGANKRNALAALDRLQRAHAERLKLDGRDPAAARVLMSDWREAANIDRRRWHEVVTGLNASGKVRIDPPYVQLVERSGPTAIQWECPPEASE